MPDAPPRLPQQLPDSQPAYAPIAPVAVAAAGVSGAFLLLTTVFGFFSFYNGRSLLEPWLLVFAAAGAVLAFVARRQIRASEGTRTGEVWANAAWYVGVVGGGAYLSYLAAVQYAVRREATREFSAWAGYLEKYDGTRGDPDLTAAVFHTLSAGQRVAVKSPTNAAAMESSQKDAILGLRSSDLARLAGRSQGELKISAGSISKWDVKPSGAIDCSLTGTAESAEGVRLLLVPMAAEVTDNKQRVWHVLPSQTGYVVGRSLTPYGWQLEAAEQAARQVTQEMFALLQKPDFSALAYAAYVQPGSDPKAAAERFAAAAASAPARTAVTGPVGQLLAPAPAGMDADLYGRVFTLADGTPATGADRERFRLLWTFPGRLVPAGAALKGSTDVNPTAAVTADGVEVTVPCDCVLQFSGQSPPTARGYVTLKPAPAEGAAFAAELAAMKAAAGGRTETPPAGVIERASALRWRVTRISSDLRPVATAPAAQMRGAAEPGEGMMP